MAEQIAISTQLPLVRETPIPRKQTLWSSVARQLSRNRGAIIGLVLLSIEVIGAIAAPWVAPYDPLQQSVTEALQAPSARHWFGTDDVGRDILSRVIHGARLSLRVGLVSVSISAIMGTVLGIAAGFYRGWFESVVMALVDVLLAFPGILLALTIIAILGPGLFNVMIAVGIGSIPTYIRVARASTLSVKEREYVNSARVVGCSNARIMFRYILPNVLPPLIVLMTLGVGGAILTASGLSFLGLGAQPPMAEWGSMLTAGRTYLRQSWWFAVFPGLAIMLTVLSINLLGDGLRDALDPKQRC